MALDLAWLWSWLLTRCPGRPTRPKSGPLGMHARPDPRRVRSRQLTTAPLKPGRTCLVRHSTHVSTHCEEASLICDEVWKMSDMRLDALALPVRCQVPYSSEGPSGLLTNQCHHIQLAEACSQAPSVRKVRCELRFSETYVRVEHS
jgi:hypothetical protein